MKLLPQVAVTIKQQKNVFQVSCEKIYEKKKYILWYYLAAELKYPNNNKKHV
jgi:hypothetical protein